MENPVSRREDPTVLCNIQRPSPGRYGTNLRIYRSEILSVCFKGEGSLGETRRPVEIGGLQ